MAGRTVAMLDGLSLKVRQLTVTFDRVVLHASLPVPYWHC